VWIVAELANAHGGDLTTAKRLAEEAVKAGADAVKVQKFVTEELLVGSHLRVQFFKSLELSDAAWRELAEWVNSLGVPLVADVFDPRSVAVMCEVGAMALKIHATDAENPSLLQQVGKTGKPVLFSTAGLTKREVWRALTWLREAGCSSIALLHGFQAFPTPLACTNLQAIQELWTEFSLPVGFQDHIDAEDQMAVVVPSFAVAAGACIIEKHITLDRSLKGSDYHSSLEPHEFRRMVSFIRAAEAARTPHSSICRGLLEDYRRRMRKVIVAKADIREGVALSTDDVTFKRTSQGGLSPRVLSRLIGRRTKLAIPCETPLTLRGVEQKVVACVAVRMKSNRLARKALVEIEGKPLLAHLVDRLRHSQLLDEIILCASTHPDDAVLSDLGRALGIRTYAGSEDDVMGRFLEAATLAGADVVVRVTGDNVFADPGYLDRVVGRLLETGSDFVFPVGLPEGTKSQAIAVEALEWAHSHAEDVSQTEYMLYYFQQPDLFHIEEVMADPMDHRPHYRLTVDTPEDLELVRSIFSHLYPRDPLFSLQDIIHLLDSSPKLVQINSHITQRDFRGQVNVRMRIAG
jgi:N,N'-diacetyllegionaminate synthase